MKLTTFQKVCLKIAKDAILEEFEIETQEIDLNDEQI